MEITCEFKTKNSDAADALVDKIVDLIPDECGLGVEITGREDSEVYVDIPHESWIPLIKKIAGE